MLQNSFYKIVNMDSGQQDCTATICLNREHEIYKAHFPGQPITPGVCQIQIVTEILALRLNEEVYLSDIKNVKYMAVISPEEVSELTVDIQLKAREQDSCKVSALFRSGEQIFSKMSMTYHVVRDNSNIQ